MFEWMSGLSFAGLAWLSIIVYALHYAEEGPRLVEWFQNHHPMKGLRYTQAKLNLENAILFGLTVAIVALLNAFPGNWVLQAAVLGTGFGYFGNFVFHAVPTIRTGVYSPGVVTASLLFPATAVLLVWKAQQTGIAGPAVLLLASALGPVALPLVVGLTHKVLLRERGT